MAEQDRLATRGDQWHRTQAMPMVTREEEARFSENISKEQVTGLLDPLSNIPQVTLQCARYSDSLRPCFTEGRLSKSGQSTEWFTMQGDLALPGDIGNVWGHF